MTHPNNAANQRRRNSPAPHKPGMKVVRVPKPALEPAEDVDEIEVPDAPDDGSVLRFSREVPDMLNPFTETETVFWVDEEKFDCYVRVPASWGLSYMRVRLTYGVEMAVNHALEKCFVKGSDAIQALLEVPNLTPEQLDLIVKKITQKFVDATKVPKGEPNSD